MSTQRICLQRFFVADHFHDLPGFCEARHGHNWKAEASVDRQDEGTELRLDQALGDWTRKVNYSLLNEQPFLHDRNPTAEVLAEWLYEHLESVGFQNVETRIREKTNYWAACRKTQ